MRQCLAVLSLVVLCCVTALHPLTAGEPTPNQQPTNVALVMPAGDARIQMLTDIGISAPLQADVVGALATAKIIIVDGSPDNLAALVAHPQEVAAFLQGRGHLNIWGVTNESLSSFNQLVGVAHILRPVEYEGLSLTSAGKQLGLTDTDALLADLTSPPSFTGAVDLHDVAPFATWPGPAYWLEPASTPGFDHWPRNMVNGLYAKNSWKNSFTIIVSKGEPTSWSITLPRRETITGFTIAPNISYRKIQHVKLTFDGDGASETFALNPVNNAQHFDFTGHPATTIKIEMVDWIDPDQQNIIGIDHIELQADRPADFDQRVVSLFNVGGLVRYPRGAGEIVLNELNVPATEDVQFHAQKESILHTLFKAEGATFGATASGFIWIECETPTSCDGVYTIQTLGNPAILSNGLALYIGVDASGADIPKKIPTKDGMTLRYDFNVLSPGSYEIWNRLGFQASRTNFRWRIDDGAWTTVGHDSPFVDNFNLGDWSDIAWTKLGTQDVTEGKHTLYINAIPNFGSYDPKHWLAIWSSDDLIKQGAGFTGNGGQATAHLLYVSDAIVLSQQPFSPNSKYKPGQAWQTDLDRQAAANIFHLAPLPTTGERICTKLDGLWMFGRYDEGGTEGTRKQPIHEAPDVAQLYWHGIQAPGDRKVMRSDLRESHRFFYRARVYVPVASPGQRYLLDLNNTSMIASVFVNGVFIAASPGPFTPWNCDITDAVKPEQINEIWVGFKDWMYARRAPGENPGTDASLAPNMGTPTGFDHATGSQYDCPVFGANESGILDSVSLIQTGSCVIDDVFTKPSVARHGLGLQVTVNNPANTPADLTVRNAIYPIDPNGAVGAAAEITFAPTTLHMAAKTTVTHDLFEVWAHPTLWWPHDGHLYEAVTTLLVNGQAIDVKHTRFGFREWSMAGNKLLLNGVPMHLRADTDGEGDLQGRTVEQVLASWRAHGQNMFDLYQPMGWAGMQPEEALDWFDAKGIPVVRTISSLSRIFDYVNYGHPGFMDPVKGQWLAHVKAERNHPCVFLWSLDHLFLSGHAPGDAPGFTSIEAQYRGGADAVKHMDPTRPVTVIGCEALSDNSLAFAAHDFNQDATDIRQFPDEAYSLQAVTAFANKHARFPLDLATHPVLLDDEQFPYGYADGRFKTKLASDALARMWPYQIDHTSWVPTNVSWIPERFAAIGGDAINTVGDWSTIPTETTLARMITEGERWLGVSAVRYAFGSRIPDHYLAWSPIAAFVREWNWSFASGSRVPRTIRIFNDTHDDAAITFSWHLSWDAIPNAPVLAAQQGKQIFTVPAGGYADYTLTLKLPASPIRRIGHLQLSCEQDGKQVFLDSKRVEILAGVAAPKPAFTGATLAVWDSGGQATQRLTVRAIPFTKVTGIDNLPPTTKVLLVGSNALSAEAATSSAWLTLVAGGVRVLVLDQDHPLQGAALPTDVIPTTYAGEIAFKQATDSPVFAGLEDQDFFTWSGDHQVYRNIYKKPTYGAQSLAQADNILACTPLLQARKGDGLFLLSQFALDGKLNTDPVATRLFDNLLNYAAAWQPPAHGKTTVLAFIPRNPYPALLTQLGLHSQTATDPLDALAKAGNGIAVVEGTPENLALLSAHADAVKQFTTAGGWLTLCGVTPDALQSFNQLTGVDHIMRSYDIGTYDMGRGAHDPLMAGLSQSDVRLTSDMFIDLTYQSYCKVHLPSPTAFNFVVDLDDLTQFLKLPPPSYWGYTAAAPHYSGGIGGASGYSTDHWPGNLTNGLLSTDVWNYAFVVDKAHGAPTSWPMELPRPEQVSGFAMSSEIYCHPTEVTLIFDGDKEHPEVLTMPAGGGYHAFTFAPRTATTITLSIDSWDNAFVPGVIGVDEIWLTVHRDATFWYKVKPLLSVGGLVKYPQGQGGILLDQLRASDEDLTLESVRKRDNLLRTLLENMGADFTETPLRTKLGE